MKTAIQPKGLISKSRQLVSPLKSPSFGQIGPILADLQQFAKSSVGGFSFIYFSLLLFFLTRSYAALRAADLDWIVGPGYSLGRVNSGEKPWKTNLEPWKTMETNQKPGRNKQKRDQGGVTTDLGGG